MSDAHFAIVEPVGKTAAGSTLNLSKSQSEQPFVTSNPHCVVDAGEPIPKGLYGPRPDHKSQSGIRQFDPYEDEWGHQLEED